MTVGFVDPIGLTRLSGRLSASEPPGWVECFKASPHRLVTLRDDPRPSVGPNSQVDVGAESLLGDYRPTVSPFPPEQVRPPFPTEPLPYVALLLALLVAVVLHGQLTGRFRVVEAKERLPALATREWLALIGLTAIAAAAFLTPSYLRYTRYGIESFDIGIYTHAFWNALHGYGLFNSPEGMDHLGSHASPGLYLLLPFYAIAPNPFTLLCLNGLALVSAVIPAYLVARRSLGTAASFGCAGVYLVNPALRSLNYDVHEVAFAVPLLMWAVLFLDARRATALLLALSAAMLFKEDIGALTCFVGAYVAVFQRRYHLGAVVSLLGVLWLVIGINIIIPYHGGSHQTFSSRYAAFGDSWIEIFLSPVLQPTALVGAAFSKSTAEYLAMVLMPFGFLPLLAPKEFLLAGAPLAENIFSSEEAMRSGIFHYEALLLPVLYLAFVKALSRVQARGLPGGGARPGAAWLETWVPAILVLVGPMFHGSIGRDFLLGTEGDPARRELDAIVALVPPGVPAVSPQRVQPHLSNRRVSAYLTNIDDFSRDHPPFHYAVIPARAKPPPSHYELVWQGASYSLFRLREVDRRGEPTQAAEHRDGSGRAVPQGGGARK